MRLKIAEHVFTLSMPEELKYIIDPYLPFLYKERVDNSLDIVKQKDLYRVEVVDTLEYEVIETLLEDSELVSEGMVQVNIYECREGLLYNIIMPQSSVVNSQLLIRDNVAKITINRHENNLYFQKSAFDNAMILSYISYTLPYNTLLLHASAIMKDGKAFLFLGKSGTGKSTHSQMWLESFSHAELLNDDHPVVRVDDSGEVLAYGSPWSGKTQCYRNLSAPLAAIVRIKRAKYNKLTKLSALYSYASVTTSISTMQWSKVLYDAKAKSLEKIITSVGCYQMECLPNNDAAICCYQNI